MFNSITDKKIPQMSHSSLVYAEDLKSDLAFLGKWSHFV